MATIIRFRGQRNLDECKTARGSVTSLSSAFYSGDDSDPRRRSQMR